MAQSEAPLNIVNEEILDTEGLEHGQDIEHAEDEDAELYEEISGKIMQTEDGAFFVATDVNTADVDLDTISKIEVIVNMDGTETLIFEAGPITIDEDGTPTEEDGQPKDSKENIRIASISGHDNHIHDHQQQMEVGAMATADDNENQLYLSPYDDADIKYGRRNRKHGKAVCPECNQSFVNTARLERHLSVHQIFGSFLCQLCGKTYKYEYNLFYHWRKTCRDLAQILDEDQRKSIDVNDLRELVEEIASKKSDLGGLEFGISAQPLYRSMGADVLDDARRSKRHVMCKACGINVLAAHLPRHLSVHHGNSAADQSSVGGGFYCDLCGLIYRQKSNLYKHWRTNCPEIMATLPNDSDLTMNDEDLRQMVEGMLKKSSLEVVNETVYKTDAERARVLDSLTADLNVDLTGIPEGEDVEDEAQNTNIFDQKWVENRGIVFADDLPNEAPYMEMARGGRTFDAHKWDSSGEVLQCPECFKPFMSASRLERHMAGYHASSGTHHCGLCGNRFKYDYNLLYHYRRSCPYTKAFIDRDVREQIDSTSLRKLVRNLAAQQPSLPASHISRMNAIAQNDAFVHKQMLQGDGDGKLPVTRIPPHNVQPPRPGLPHGYRCPHCNIIFYGTTAIRLHMRMRHQEEFEVKGGDKVMDEEIITEMPHDTLSGTIDHDLPPKLELEEHKPRPRHRIYDEQGNDITNTPEVQQLIASGEIQFNDGEEIILVNQEPDIEQLEYFETQEVEVGHSKDVVEVVEMEQASSRDQPENEAEIPPNEEQQTAAATDRSTRRSTRLSRTFGAGHEKDQENEMEVDPTTNEAGPSSTGDKTANESSVSTTRRSARKRKDESTPPPPSPQTTRRQTRHSDSVEISPRRSLRSRNAR